MFFNTKSEIDLLEPIALFPRFLLILVGIVFLYLGKYLLGGIFLALGIILHFILTSIKE